MYKIRNFIVLSFTFLNIVVSNLITIPLFKNNITNICVYSNSASFFSSKSISNICSIHFITWI